MEWDGMEWDGMGYNRTERNGMEWDGIEDKDLLLILHCQVLRNFSLTNALLMKRCDRPLRRAYILNKVQDSRIPSEF